MGDVKQRLDIVPLTLAQFQKYFIAMFEAEKANPEQLRDLILKCESRRDILEAPAWKQYIDATVSDKATEITAFASLPFITQENSQPETALKRSPAQQDFSVVQTEHS